jgi:hypothetical protein
VGPLPEAVGLPVPDTVPTPESGGCGVELASWDRGHDSSQVRAENGAGQQPCTWKLPAQKGGEDAMDITQTSKHLPHTCREEASTVMTPQWGAGKQVRLNE